MNLTENLIFNPYDDEKEIEVIAIRYKDGSEKHIKKGFAGTYYDGNLNIDFAMISGKEVTELVWAWVLFANELGMFDKGASE